MDVNSESFNLAFSFAAVYITLLWVIDWRRYARAYRLYNPEKRPLLTKILRGFFLLCFVGAFLMAVRRLLEKQWSGESIRQAFKDSLILLGIWVVMVIVVDFLDRDRRKQPVDR
jgi:hypothetical protein